MSATSGPQFYIEKAQALEHPDGQPSADIAFVAELLKVQSGEGSDLMDTLIALATAADDDHALEFLNAVKASAEAVSFAGGSAAPTAAATADTTVLRDANGSAAINVTELGSVPVSNKAMGGSVGTAATTVDVATVLQVDQTTAAQTLTLPNPTSATAVRELIVYNSGSEDFTMLAETVTAGTAIRVMWTGSAWVVL